MYNSYHKYLPVIIKIFIVCVVFFTMYFISTTLIFYILPFILGWIIATLIQPLVRFLTIQLKIPRNLSTFIALSLFVLLTGSMLALMGGVVVLQLTKLSIMLPEYSKKLYFQGIYFIKSVQNLYIQLPPDIAQSIINGLNALLENFTSLLGKLISSLLSIISGIPGFFVFLLVTLISSFFMARDKRKILRFMVTQLPSNTLSKGRVFKNDLFYALMGYIRAQLILMSITFIESAIGLTMIGIDYSILFALLASMIDALPILGTGSVYIPLILWNLLSGRYATGGYLTILYGIIILVRQLLEPKILGTQIGLYPLVTLMAMYMGLKLFGVFGLIIGPISMIVLMTLQKVHILPQWKK